MVQALVDLDRRVAIIEGPSDVKGQTVRISELRTHPRLVLLGEPGSGKSSVLSLEAAASGKHVMRAFHIATLPPGSARGPIFIDALDEYRVDGRGVERAYELGNALRIGGATQWRIACRSEDWQKEADLDALGHEAVVVKLLPLEDSEVALILASLGERDTNAFIRRAYELGAEGFLRNPLSLKLLHKAVKEGGDWPRTRYDLFQLALDRLALEHNFIHRAASRRTRPEILAAAKTTCAVLLLSGAHGIWRSHGEPPFSTDQRNFVHAYEMGIEREVVDDMLDSSLFVGEGDVFEPMHRTIAEFLAGRRLAEAIVPERAKPAIPLSRALALISGRDGQPPTPLRGVYAWLAAHLSKLGAHEHAEQLIEVDAPSVLFYGDAAAFDTLRRRRILACLSRSDPFFRATETRDVVVSSLGGPDLTTEFLAVLDDTEDRSHRMLTVFDVIEQTVAEDAIRSRLYDLVLDSGRPSWQRLRAADAWLCGADANAHLLWSAMKQLPPSIQREELRLHAARRMPKGTLNLSEIKQLIADFAATPEDDTVGRLVGLWGLLDSSIYRELLDEPLARWLPAMADPNKVHRVELNGFLDHALAEAIYSEPGIPPERVWRWICNFRAYEFQDLSELSTQALQRWLAAADDRAVRLLECILAFQDSREAPWLAMNDFVSLCGWRYDGAVIPHLLDRADREPENRKWLVAAAVQLARYHPGPFADETIGYLLMHPEHEELVARVLSPREIEVPAPTESRETSGRDQRIAKWMPLIERIRVGELHGVLAWGADLYFESSTIGDIDCIACETNNEIAAAILEGWQHVVTQGLGSISLQSIAIARGENKTYYIERAVLAGIDYKLSISGQPLQSVTPPVIIAALERSWMVQGELRRNRFLGFAIEQLDNDVNGENSLYEFWRDALDAGATHLESFDRLAGREIHSSAVQAAVTRLITERRHLPLDMLRSGLRRAIKSISPEEILGLAMDELGDVTLGVRERALWTIATFAVAPEANRIRLSMLFDASASELLEELRSLDLEEFPALEPGFRVLRLRLLFSIIAPKVPPNEDMWVDRDDSLVARYAMRNLQSSPDEEAGDSLRLLAKELQLVTWRPHLLHAYAQWARENRDRTHQFPTVEAALAVLNAGPPANEADLMAIVETELDLLGRDLRVSDLDSWKFYWNIDPRKPLVENECRNRLLDQLRNRLARYTIGVALPEVQCHGATRTDISVFSNTGVSLPIEIKRHMHPELWSAPLTQLIPYTNPQGAQGYGIYLVFWFGSSVARTPGRDEGAAPPCSASHLQALLQEDIAAFSGRIKAIVLDVSDPKNTVKSERKSPYRGRRRKRIRASRG